MMMGWPEMVQLRAAAGLALVDLHGAVSVAMENWIDRMGLTAKVRYLGHPVAAFQRDRT